MRQNISKTIVIALISISTSFARSSTDQSNEFNPVRIPIDSTTDSITNDVWVTAWTGHPENICSSEDNKYTSCRCEGLRYGKKGAITLFRKRKGVVIDSIWIDQSSGLSVWKQDFDTSKPDTTHLRKISLSKPLRFAEDSLSAIFPFLYAKKSCESELWFAVGVTAKNKQLHFLNDRENNSLILLNSYGTWQGIMDHPNSDYLETPCTANNLKYEQRGKVVHWGGEITSFKFRTSCADTNIDIAINDNLINNLYQSAFNQYKNANLTTCLIQEIKNHYSNDAWKVLMTTDQPLVDAVIEAQGRCESNNPGIFDSIKHGSVQKVNTKANEDRIYVRNDSAIITNDTSGYLPNYFAWGRKIKEHLSEYCQFDEYGAFFAKRTGDLVVDKGALVMTFETSKFTDSAYYLGLVRIKTVAGVKYCESVAETVYDTDGNIVRKFEPLHPKWEVVMRDSYLFPVFDNFNYPKHFIPAKGKIHN